MQVERARCTFADFIGADLSGSNLTDTQLDSVRLVGADLFGCSPGKARFLPLTLPKWEYPWIQLREAANTNRKLSESRSCLTLNELTP
ncbi:MAG: pentapeptide repeat-containing protein [Dehalococcoidia bacterium]|nr:pentapeptide repeat-containing protein [Dehalococcoidia bacterium]